jgi:uncharacterized Ntn-hydrolase superfamily protein
MTFSIVARCDRTGMYGVAVTSSSIAVASRCAWSRTGTGAVATQNLTNPSLGNLGLDLLGRGLHPEIVRDMLVQADPQPAYRQLLIVGRAGSAVYTGVSALPLVASFTHASCAAAGNLLASEDIPAAMGEAFLRRPGQPLAERLISALLAGLAAGGEVRQLQSAGVQVVDREPWPVVDLRVDAAVDPLTRLEELWHAYAPLQAGYVERATEPQKFDISVASARQGT